MSWIKVLDESDLPLCPNSMPPVHSSHQVRTRLLNAFYGEMSKHELGGDNVGELPEHLKPLEDAYHAAAYTSSASDRMQLFRTTSAFLEGRFPKAVEAFYYRCGTCGTVLPASRTPS